MRESRERRRLLAQSHGRAIASDVAEQLLRPEGLSPRMRALLQVMTSAARYTRRAPRHLVACSHSAPHAFAESSDLSSSSLQEVDARTWLDTTLKAVWRRYHPAMSRWLRQYLEVYCTDAVRISAAYVRALGCFTLPCTSHEAVVGLPGLHIFNCGSRYPCSVRLRTSLTPDTSPADRPVSYTHLTLPTKRIV